MDDTDEDSEADGDLAWVKPGVREGTEKGEAGCVGCGEVTLEH